MTVKELKAFFKEHLVPSRLYNLKGGSHGGRICLGKNKQDSWEVSEACQHMMDEVRKVMEQVYGVTWKGLA